jgi:tRNA 2-thiouridine synthesizing protein A
MIEFDLEVDAAGLHCPLPLLRLKKALSEINTGQIIKLIATDPAAHLDIGVYSQQSGHPLLNVSKQTSSVQVFYVEKK